MHRLHPLRRLKSALGSALLVEYPSTAMNKTSKRVNGKNRSSTNSVNRTKRSAAKSRTRTIAVAGNNSRNSETKEERERRLAKRETLTIHAFQKPYDNYHNN